MNYVAQQHTEVHTGRETPPTAPKVLFMFVSHVAPSTINMSLSAISYLLQDTTSYQQALLPQTSKGHSGEGAHRTRQQHSKSLICLSLLKAGLPNFSSSCDCKKAICKNKPQTPTHKQHFITEDNSVSLDNKFLLSEKGPLVTS